VVGLVVNSDRTDSYCADSSTQGLNYLHKVQSYLPNLGVIDVLDNIRDRTLICTWISTHIDSINTILRNNLLACHQCYPASAQKPMHIFAVPLAQSLGIDGFCDLSNPTPLLLIDTGRVRPSGWLALVAHEYAHAHSGRPGHDRTFAEILTHLCLGLGLEVPVEQTESTLRRSPPYASTYDPLAFWRGET
jgi:hypothetical protein